MKTLFYTLLPCLLLCLSCSSESSDTPEQPQMSISYDTQSGINFGYEASNLSIQVYCNKQLQVSSSDGSWCTVSVADSGSENTYTCTVTATENTSTEQRSTAITFRAETLERVVTVTQSAAPAPVVENDARAMARRLGLGWNLGNQLDAYVNEVADETSWDNQPATQATFDKVAAAGFTSVRIPVTWLGKVGEAPDYAIAPDWLARVEECVGYAENAGLNVIINIHHDGADSEHWLDIKSAATNSTVNDEIKARLTAMWTQIAQRFINKGDFLIFESMNEIQDGGWGWGDNRNDGGRQYAILNDWNQTFVNAVRATGGNNATRYLGVPGYSANPDLTINYLELPDDPAGHTMVAVHFYDPYEYTLNNTYTEWGHTASSGNKAPNGDEDNVTTVFGNLMEKYVNNNIPVYIGEIGCVHRDTERAEAFRKYYLEYVCKAARTYGIAPFYWDNGAAGTGTECSGLFNHATGEYLNNGKDIVEVMVRGIFNDDASYTLETVYNTAP